MELESSKCRRVDLSTARSVEGAAEWRLHNIGVMRSFYATPGRPRGGCECEHFHLPGFPEVQFTFMVYPLGMGTCGTPGTPPVALALHLTGIGCEGVGFEVDLSLSIQRMDGSELTSAQELRAAPLAGAGRVSCESLWPTGGEVLVAGCHVLAAPPPRGDPVLRLSTTWQPPARAELDDDIERLDGDDDEFD
ncbi:hypothetical protein AK812_SmicGene30437 [Symbiodinium microadriaticum]|uniref:Uncharacterized protein n=1 Tax=Symbiodinium microadriaticum TaxID=2951 RepID=A0A1Q9CZC9_SYMMI|nr:hypothetical protein AK812_SmicGene30437 [Symbiodinium microadriaticum]CAE7546198.1 unnamed protein product [Symbiodinium microadriaticum]CAE7948070.1 unnamed protein product [Symbiodinium sp. KB8]